MSYGKSFLPFLKYLSFDEKNINFRQCLCKNPSRHAELLRGAPLGVGTWDEGSRAVDGLDKVDEERTVVGVGFPGGPVSEMMMFVLKKRYVVWTAAREKGDRSDAILVKILY